MSAVAPPSEPTNLPIGEVRLLAAVRWLVALILVHWLIGCARKLIAGLQLGPTDPDDTFLLRHFGTTDTAVILPRASRALRRATALQADLHARRPTEQDFSTKACRAIAVELIAICRDLGILRAKSISAVAKRVHRRIFHRSRRTPPARRGQVRSIGPLRGPIPLRATGPPWPHHGDAENDELRIADADVPLGLDPRARTRVFFVVRTFLTQARWRAPKNLLCV